MTPDKKIFKAPDLNASRFRKKMHNLIDRDFEKRFISKYPQYSKMSGMEMRKIIYAFNNLLKDTVIDYRDGVELPEALGNMFIGSCINTKKVNIDFTKSIKYGVRVTNNNWATDGRLAKIMFTSCLSKYKYVNRQYWGFTACRLFKRKVSKVYPENWNMYISVDPVKKIKEVCKN
jgi:hypothetical protein